MPLRSPPPAALALCASLALASGLAPAAVFRIDNPSPSDDARFGTAIAALGDVDGDGVADFAVGAPGANRVDILSGATRSVVRSLTDPEGLASAQFGYSLALIGDVDGDGIGDLAVGAPGAPGALPLPCGLGGDPCPDPTWGRVFLFSAASGATIRKVVPGGEFFLFGFSLVAPGDIDGDGISDVVVGSPMLLNNRWGEVYAFSGTSGAPLWVFREPPYPTRQAVASLGMYAAPIGDTNGDGRGDVLVSAPFHDSIGSGSMLSGRAFVLSGANGSAIRSHQAPAPLDDGLYGAMVGAIGDQDGDGVADYLVGHRGQDEILLYSGASGQLIRPIASPEPAGDGPLSFARAGERDAENGEDFWTGIPAESTAVLVNGNGAALLEAADPGAQPANVQQRFAISLAALADQNGDGKPEVAIGKPGEAVGGQAAAGSVFVVTSNLPPAADAGVPQTVAAGATCIGPVVLDGSGSSDPDGDALTYTWTGPFGTATGVAPAVSLPLGQHTVTLTVDDGNGGSDTDTVVVTVADQTAPLISAVTPSTNLLWPPDHRMLPATIAVAATDNCDAAPVCRIAGVQSNEPENGLGDGDTAPDWRIAGELAVEVRAERSGTGAGRRYTVAVNCEDFSGNGSAAATTIAVPRDRR